MRNITHYSDFIGKLLLFIIWPFGAFLASLIKPNSKSSYCIYWLFGILFCWSMYYKGESIDFNNIVLRFYAQPDLSFNELIERITNLYTDNSKDSDIYNILLNWVTQQFSNNFHTLFAIASIPYLFFMLNSLKYITNDEKRFSSSTFCYLILLLFVLPKDIFWVQNFRFTTATWVSIYALIKTYYSGQKSYWLLLFVTPLIHSSFWFLIIVAILYVVSRKIPIKYIYYISLPFILIPTDLLSKIDLSFIPSSLSIWSKNYLNEDAYSTFGMGRSGSGLYWISKLFNILHFYSYAVAIIIMANSKELKNAEKGIKELFSFQLLFLTITNFIQVIPVLGSRFLNNSLILTIFLWYKIMYPKKNILLIIILFGWAFELMYYIIPHYNAVLDIDFFLLNVFSLISKYWGVTNF